MSLDLKSLVIVPTLNGGDQWKKWIAAYSAQDVKPFHTLIVDSGSSDHTTIRAKEAGFSVHTIRKEDFNHARTRDLALKLSPPSDLVIFLTQDAILADPGSLRRLIQAFEDPNIAAAYGRQLPHPSAGPLASHARSFNYGAESRTISLLDANRLGHKAIFFSNSFAAYRRSALEKVGGFDFDTIIAEDVIVAGKILLAGGSLRYCAGATVYHSHDYSAFHEMRRYFDIGVFHRREKWITERFGKAQGEGVRFAMSELRYLWQRNPSLILASIFRNALKLVGYQMGRREAMLSNGLKRLLSMHAAYWGTSSQPGSD